MDSFLFQTPTQWAILILLLIAGWFFGLASHPGGRKWKRRYHELDERSRERERLLEQRERELADVRAERDRLLEERRKWAPAGTSYEQDELSAIRGIDPELAQRLRHEGHTRYADIAALSDDEAAGLEDRLGLSKGRVAQEDWRTQADLLNHGNVEEHARRFS